MEKSQLIIPASPKKTILLATCIGVFGFILFTLGLLDTVRFYHVISPFRDSASGIPAVRAGELEDWSNVGQAISGYIGLATLGALVASSGFVIRQVELQKLAMMTQSQPILACAALLAYKLEGVSETKRVKISQPVIQLRLKNLGDSPATFIEAAVNSLVLTNGGKQESLRHLTVPRMYRDHLGPSKRGVEHEQDAIVPICRELPERAVDLIDNILTEDSTDDASLELRVTISHRNVSDLRYVKTCRFRWLMKLQDAEQSDAEQCEYIRGFREARKKGYAINSESRKLTIGHFINSRSPLQGTLVGERILTRLKAAGRRVFYFKL